MFTITRNGVVTRNDSQFSALVAENLPEVADYWGLIEESPVVAFLILDLVAWALAPTTRYSYRLHHRKFANWCGSNNRRAMPPDIDTLAIYFPLLALRQKTPKGVLAARSTIKFLFSVANLDSESPTDSNRISPIVQGMGKKFGGFVNKRIVLTPD